MSLLDRQWLESARDKRWLVGVSGGRDSVALLHSCIEANIKDLIIAHVNHGLRGDESEGDAVFVEELANQLGLHYCSVKIDIREIAASEKKSIELAAREARQEFFSSQIETNRCTGVLLGHHADDQAETILFNLLRGSAGLKGMSSEQHMDDLNMTIFRPMLNTSREEINTYITNNNLHYREDSSNTDDFATRNRMRNEAIPLLEDIMGRKISPALIRALRFSEQKEALVNQMVNYESFLDPQGRLFLPSLKTLSTPLQEKVLYQYLTEQKISNISQSTIEEAIKLLDINQPAKMNLPKGKFLRRSQQRIFIEESE